jgi:hypothetical protein
MGLGSGLRAWAKESCQMIRVFLSLAVVLTVLDGISRARAEDPPLSPHSVNFAQVSFREGGPMYTLAIVSPLLAANPHPLESEVALLLADAAQRARLRITSRSGDADPRGAPPSSTSSPSMTRPWMGAPRCSSLSKATIPRR